MSAARRRERRQARIAARQLLKSGIPLNAIGTLSTAERYRRFLDKVVDAAEKRVDTGEGGVSVREGLAAIKEIRTLDREKAELVNTEPTAEELAAEDAANAAAETAYEQDEASREAARASGPQISGQDGRETEKGSAAAVHLTAAAS
ncbi:MAG: hypothetical protein IT462_17440 [Planctomycetes bacterium]|nr:hypothetical protein [Planctomycetota bacterium]